MPGKQREHYSGDYNRRAKLVRRAAYANHGTLCGQCGRTLAQHGNGATWDAGHVISGNPASALRAEASSCNRSAGATEGNRRRSGVVSSRKW